MSNFKNLFIWPLKIDWKLEIENLKFQRVALGGFLEDDQVDRSQV